MFYSGCYISVVEGHDGDDAKHVLDMNTKVFIFLY